MKTKNVIIVLIAILMVQLAGAQVESVSRGHYQYFNNDSLAGFDEDLARRSAIHDGFLGEEYPVRMNQLKRQYINSKFNLWGKPTPRYDHSWGARPSVVPGCVNED